MSMTKQQKIGVCLGSAFGLCALALGWFFYSAYADHQVALEGDEEEGTKGLNAAKEENNRYYAQSNPFPSSGAIASVKSNEVAYVAWKDGSLELASKGDCPPSPIGLAPTVFKNTLYEQVTKMQKLPGGVVGRICASTFQFGFDKYLGEAGGTPEPKDIPKLYAQLATITNVVDLFAKSGVLEVRAFERLESQEDADEDNGRNVRGRNKDKGKNAKDAVSAEEPTRYDFRLEYTVRASGFVKVLNGLAKSPRFYIVSDFGFEHEGETLKARLDRMASSASGEASSRGRRRRGEKKEEESAESGFVTNPETDLPILVRMKLSVYDFGTGGSRVDADKADKAEDAPAPSKKEGN